MERRKNREVAKKRSKHVSETFQENAQKTLLASKNASPRIFERLPEDGLRSVLSTSSAISRFLAPLHAFRGWGPPVRSCNAPVAPALACGALRPRTRAPLEEPWAPKVANPVEVGMPAGQPEVALWLAPSGQPESSRVSTRRRERDPFVKPIGDSALAASAAPVRAHDFCGFSGSRVLLARARGCCAWRHFLRVVVRRSFRRMLA
jgi:hypothetical protein